MIFLGIDRATSSKVLRLHITPSAVAYRTYELAEASDVYTKSEIDTSLSGKANASDVMPKSGGTFTGVVYAKGYTDTASLKESLVYGVGGYIGSAENHNRVKTQRLEFTRK